MRCTRVLCVTFACFAERSHWFWVIFVAYKRISSGAQHSQHRRRVLNQSSATYSAQWAQDIKRKGGRNGGGVLGWWNCDKAEGWAVRQSCLGWQKKKGSASELARSGGICFDNTMQGEIKSTDFIVINMNISILSTFVAVRGEVSNSR